MFRLGQPTATVVHLALLRLARREGIGAAYACVTDRRFAANRMQRALAEVEPDPILELAALEGRSSVSGSSPLRTSPSPHR